MYLWAEKENANITNRKQSRYTLLLPPEKKDIQKEGTHGKHRPLDIPEKE